MLVPRAAECWVQTSLWPSPATARKCSLLATTALQLRQPGRRDELWCGDPQAQGRSFPFFDVPQPELRHLRRLLQPLVIRHSAMETSVTSTANCAPLNRGRPSATISILRPGFWDWQDHVTDHDIRGHPSACFAAHSGCSTLDKRNPVFPTPLLWNTRRDDGQNNQVNGRIDMHVNKEGEEDGVAETTGHGTTAG